MRDDEVTRASFEVGATADRSGGPAEAPVHFAPGDIVAGRYRLVTLLGRGGMGEVYRADDLTLDHPVALKFLPAHVAADPARLAAFHNELRTARQVSHKNVCRLHDLGEADGRRFLTMEYVDGEDLASLLRRVGRVPEERALQMARQMCAGTAAAHERGVIHRDLKPANVMIDSAGDVRITDFGIATAAGRSGDALAGTPQYMAPEQLSGAPASTASDIYGLGLILFELFTGRRAVEGRSISDLKDFHQTGTITTPTSIVRDLDPAIERVILRCLDRDPARRPHSALAVAAALPGGDPLAAALAAGETPSPELLAAAGEREALPVRRGLTFLAMAVIGLLVFAVASSRLAIASRVPLDEPPAVLVDRAEQFLAAISEAAPAADSAYGFAYDRSVTGWLRRTRQGPDRWAPLATGAPSAVRFWYRTSETPLRPFQELTVTENDPPVVETGMRLVVLDPRGRLQLFRAVPPARMPKGNLPGELPWRRAFEAAGLDMSAFVAATPEWTPVDYADMRAAWDGPLPGSSDLRVRVEANAFAGRLTSFSVIGPWTRSELAEPRRQSSIARAIEGFAIVGFCALVAAAAALATRNLRTNRADRRGAALVAATMTLTGILAWVFGAHHSLAIEAEYESLFRAAGTTLVVTSLVWPMYLALEPYVRRLWPDSLLGWSRLTSGHIHDPRVGYDVLVGAAVGVAVALIAAGRASVIPWLGYPAPVPIFGENVHALLGPGAVMSATLLSLFGALESALIAVLIVVFIRLAVRRTWLSIAISVVVLSLPFLDEAGTTSTSLVFVFALASGAILTYVVFRAGLLALAAALFVYLALMNVPFMPEIAHWGAPAGHWTLIVVVVLMAFGFYASRAGQPLFGEATKA